MLCIIPAHYSDIELGGWGQAAFVLDTEYTFDVHRLTRLIRARIDKILSLLDDSEWQVGLDDAREEILQEALQNLHIFHPTSSIQLAATISYLSLYHHEESHVQHRELGLLVVDSMSSFYWQDRFTTEQLRGGQSSDIRTPFRNVLTEIERFNATHRPTIILTNWGLNSLIKSSSAGTSPFFRQHLYPMPPGFVHRPAEAVAPSARPAMEEETRYTAPSHIAPEHEPSSAHSPTFSSLSLTHHITVLREETHPSSGEEPLEYEQSPRDSDAEANSCQFLGLVRTPGSKAVRKIRFSIRDDHIAIHPKDIFQR